VEFLAEEKVLKGRNGGESRMKREVEGCRVDD